MRALDTGNIGIGTNNPARKVEIFDTAATVLQLNSINSGETSLRIQNSGTDKCIWVSQRLHSRTRK